MNEIDGMKREAIIIPVAGSVLLPGTSTMIQLSEKSEEQLMKLKDREMTLIALPQKNGKKKAEIKQEDLYTNGVIFIINGLQEVESGVRLIVSLRDRVTVKELTFEDDLIYGQYDLFPDVIDLNEENQKTILSHLKQIVNDISGYFTEGEQFLTTLNHINDINYFIVYLSRFIMISQEERYELLSIDSLKERSLRFMDHLLQQKESIEIQLQISEKYTEKANKFYRENMLREQMKAIQEELNEGKGSASRKDSDYRMKIEESNMPDDVKEIAYEELDKLNMQGTNGSEYSSLRNYLDLLIQLPWGQETSKPVDLEEARKILNEQHYGLEKVKKRIIQHLAVMQLNKEKHGSILLLVGPPGTGKTSLGKSIAEALDRKYIRVSLGGIRDEAEIRGHRRTYIGSMPGRIIQNIRKAGTNQPVMVLDEVDKLMMGGYSGDPASALLEVLDPEQNNTFTDHYLDIPYDLSNVFFIATANSLDSIPGPLLDRMEVINISSYTTEEKFHIGKDHLLPEVLKAHGLTSEQLIVSDEVMREIISEYTSEAGVRGLKRKLETLARVASEKIVSEGKGAVYTATKEDLTEALGRMVSHHDKAQTDNPAGVVTGLAWTPVGGEILFIEATNMPGNGDVILTGKLGDVMKESARISLSLLKSRLPIDSINFKERDLHIHVPSGSVPKDGPSAGIALFTALASLITGKKVDPKLAMTGEITLRGAVLPIGGLKEKLLGAQRAGIKKVLIPKENEVDLKDVPDEVKKEITIVAVETVEDVLREALGISLPRIENLFKQPFFGKFAM